MLYKLHYWFFAAGINAIGILLGVFIEEYSDATPMEIGALFMVLPFVQIFTKPFICSRADRTQSHRSFMMWGLIAMALTYTPYVAIPFFGEQLYKQHGRLCWWLLVVFKVSGTIAIGAVGSLGDSLAINYAKRIGTKFSVYRIWAVASWMTFGLIVGQINELPFVPKYVPGFTILVLATSIDTLIIYLWPPDYFRMVAIPAEPERAAADRLSRPAKQQVSGLAAMTHSLLPKEVVWAHAKGQLKRLLTCGCLCPSGWRQRQQLHLQPPTKGLPVEEGLELPATPPEKVEPIRLGLQVRVLWLIMRRDPRVVLYLSLCVVCGLVMSPLNFFFMNLSRVCNERGTCNFSQLAGYLQASMASVEFLVFFYVETIIAKLGRINVITVGFLLIALKYLFYGTLWQQVDPHYSLLVECVQGVMYTICVTIMVAVGHMFSSEAELVLPDLVAQGLVKEGAEAERVKLSLAATMQALFSIAFDCVGHALGGFIFGWVIGEFGYTTLWLLVSSVAGATFVLLILVNLFDHIAQPRLGPTKPPPPERAALG